MPPKKQTKKDARIKKVKKAKPAKKQVDWAVEKIEKKKIIKGRVHYRVKWSGYASYRNTWEPLDHLNCPELIREFLLREKEKKQAAPPASSNQQNSRKREPQAAGHRTQRPNGTSQTPASSSQPVMKKQKKQVAGHRKRSTGPHSGQGDQHRNEQTGSPISGEDPRMVQPVEPSVLEGEQQHRNEQTGSPISGEDQRMVQPVEPSVLEGEQQHRNEQTGSPISGEDQQMADPDVNDLQQHLLPVETLQRNPSVGVREIKRVVEQENGQIVFVCRMEDGQRVSVPREEMIERNPEQVAEHFRRQREELDKE